MLLYEKGKDALEPVVRDVLRSLGARVEELAVEGIEDGLVFYGELAAVLEVKGRRHQVKQDDVRQVSQSAADAKLRDGREYKPLIVANAYAETHPDERGDPIAPNAKTFAVNGGVAILTTVQLYDALRRSQAGGFDVESFWRSVFNAEGLAELPVPPRSAPADVRGAGPTST